MADVARVLVALALVALSFIVWRWLQPAAASASSDRSADKKKPSKKKTTKKKKKTGDKATAVDASTTTSAVADSPHAVADATNDDDDDDDDSDDEDAGLTAKQILARRRFKPKALGGQSAAAAAAASAAAVSAARFQAGQRVVARFQGGPDWFPGVIHEVRRGNEYHIKYDDGEVEHHVPHARIQDEAAFKKAAEEEAQSRALDARLTTLAPRLNADADDEADDAESSSNDGDGDDGDESEDGWQVVEKKRRPTGGTAAAAVAVDAEKVDADGLTKRQREARRKKERKKEQKEQLRAQAQEHGLHARWGGTMNRLKYVPPPTAQAPPS